MQRPLTRAEMIHRQQGISHEQIAEDRLWNKRPDGIALQMPTDTKSGVICLLEFKRMSDVTSQHTSALQDPRTRCMHCRRKYLQLIV
jgi:hypothetical protein